MAATFGEELKYTTSEGGAPVEVDAVLTLNSTQNADGSYTIVGISGTRTTGSTVNNITGLEPVNTDSSDNEFWIDPTKNTATGSYVDFGGFTYITDGTPNASQGDPATAKSSDVNFYYNTNSTANSTGLHEDQINPQPDVTNVTVSPVCFVAGTRIATKRGDIAIEDLVVGDLVVTSSSARRPIRWLGHRITNCRAHPCPREAMPIRIAAHACGENRPTRDLLVSPGHAICLDVDVFGEVLIPAIALVNGTTVRQVEADAVAYWHVELDSHDVILAENLPCESYLDMENRGFFREAQIVDLAAGPDANPARHTHADFCRPFHADGEVVEAVREQLRARAEALGWQQRQDDFAGLYLVVDGARIEAAWRGLSACFVLPADADEVWLMSGATRPCDVARSDDTRALGLSLQAITLTDGFETLAIALDDERLEEGFWQVEGAGEMIWRWTNGRARLPAALWAASVRPKLLRIDLAQPSLPWWAPQAPLAENAENDLAPVAATGAG